MHHTADMYLLPFKCGELLDGNCSCSIIFRLFLVDAMLSVMNKVNPKVAYKVRSLKTGPALSISGTGVAGKKSRDVTPTSACSC